MILIGLIFWLVAGGLLAWLSGWWNKEFPRWISLIALILSTIVVIWIWMLYLAQGGAFGNSRWMLEINVPWIPELGISLHLGLDGLNLLLVLLVNLMGIMAVAASWTEVQKTVGFFHFNLLWVSAALIGIFLALDLILFYFFWEMMLIPLYFLIGIWGHERRIYATLKFFLFTQASGLLMLLAILGLYVAHGQNTGVYTFSYTEMLGSAVSPSIASWLMLGFFAAFGVKLAAVPLHSWLPDAHTQAPTAGSVVLASLVLKAGAYGFLRFLIPLFPATALSFAPVAMSLGVVSILYGAILAFGQTDLKRLVAYTSISHMGFVLLGIFSWNQLALQGAVVIMIAHGISTGALFILSGEVYDRIGTRDMRRMGGLWSTTPRLGGTTLVFALASLGLPGLGNFVGEFLVLLGAYQVSVPLAVLATLGFIVATVYSLWMIQAVFFGQNTEGWRLSDLNLRETAIMAVLVAIIVWLGLYPQTVLNTAKPALEGLLQTSTLSQPAAIHPQDAAPGPPSPGPRRCSGKPL